MDTEQIQLLEKMILKSDSNSAFREQLLKKPGETLSERGIHFTGSDVIAEYTEGYGTFVAFCPAEKDENKTEAESKTEDTLAETHFLDCMAPKQ